jgi:hypothetical protein
VARHPVGPEGTVPTALVVTPELSQRKREPPLQNAGNVRYDKLGISTPSSIKNEPTPSPKRLLMDLIAPGETRIETWVRLIFSVDR